MHFTVHEMRLDIMSETVENFKVLEILNHDQRTINRRNVLGSVLLLKPLFMPP